jgi:hypothetical protein
MTTSGGGESVWSDLDQSPHRSQVSFTDPSLWSSKRTSVLRPQHRSAHFNPQQKLLSPSWGITAHTAGRHLGRDIKPRCCKPWQGLSEKMCSMEKCTGTECLHAHEDFPSHPSLSTWDKLGELWQLLAWTWTCLNSWGLWVFELSKDGVLRGRNCEAF